jgi:hypothetical protein
MSARIVLPTPLPSSSITLGQFITNPLESKIVSYNPSSKPLVQETTRQAEYRDTVIHDKNGSFVSATCDQDYILHDNVLLLSAEESSLASLVQPRATFNKLGRNTTTQPFLQRSNLEGQPLYFVTGIQTLKNPTFKRATVTQGSIAEAPGNTIRLPMHAKRMDSVVSLENSATEDVNNDETIFAVELLKVRCRIGAASEPHDLEDIDYDWTYHNLNDEGLQMSIGLGKAVQASDLRAHAHMQDDEDLTDQSWGYGSDDDEEGLGGF